MQTSVASSRKILYLLIGFILCSFASIGQKAVPELWGQRVHDEAHVLKAETVDLLEKELALYEDSTTNQIAILIVQSLDGDVLVDYSCASWKNGNWVPRKTIMVYFF